ncbi:DUF7146 domain-containing protein [Paracoccus onubensis]|uniref:Zinc finger CHC2-type domain-containing protein n=1 Tax=Paracoccus onubensis TaxID=1675788 RepID=A0A418T475_9RHOB|nr:CHC2 zinc finger domain-containing protein [Paracoccus onubensis]RJE87975.1 hypothetical protein D3P04_03375 [Paracoccus onubensis]
MVDADPRIDAAHAMPMAELVDRLQIAGLVRTSGELVGPCPSCGGKDRFGINLQKQIFNCRVCGAKGDQIALVQLALGMDFPAALEWLVGPRQELTPAQLAEQRRKREAAERRRHEAEEKARARTIRAARKIWFSTQPAEGTQVREYLTLRGITRERLPVLPPSIRFDPEARYMIPVSGTRDEWQTLHVGPAMVAAVVDPSGRVTAVHRTWLDLSQPKGKVILPDPHKDGELLPAKKVLGSKKGGAIRLASDRDARIMVMGEGLETTFSALVAHPYLEPASYWCGVDLGNMAGRRKLGPGLKYAGIPDMDDDRAWVPPESVRRLVFIQDGDSDPRLTRAKLEAGLRRAMMRRPGLSAAIAYPGEGKDLNDILMGDDHG